MVTSGHRGKVAVSSQEVFSPETKYAGTLILHFSASKTVRKYVSVM